MTINCWWVSRPKRKLNSVPEVLASFAQVALNQEWEGQRTTHLSLEDVLEVNGLKRKGERRDQSGSGARTYKAWLYSLGLIFVQKTSGNVKLTLAGEALLSGKSPVAILKNQVLKYQFPSAFSVSRGVNVNSKFRIRPFRFLLKLLSEPRLEYYLTQDEIAKIIIVEGENESDKCFEIVVNHIINFRTYGECALTNNYESLFSSYYNMHDNSAIFSYLGDIANTIINWIEYTQLAKRDEQDKKLKIIEGKELEVANILSERPSFIFREDEAEFFQRKYGLDPSHIKDTRNFAESNTVTPLMIIGHQIKHAFISMSLKEPISKIDGSLVKKISDQTGADESIVAETLSREYSKGAIGTFMAEYFEMAFKGRDEATDFEKATVSLFKNVLGFDAIHVGPIGLTPDVLILSDNSGYVGIIDNKAYSKYSISNDHRNRMVHNYIPKYASEKYPLAFFSYIAGGFANTINSQIKSIADETGTNGSAINVTNMIEFVEKYQDTGCDHAVLRNLFSINRQVLRTDF